MKTYIINHKNHKTLMPFFVTLLASLLWLIFFYEGKIDRLFVTADQVGFKSYIEKNYRQAAENFENLSFKGASYYKYGAFKKAKMVYQNLSSKEDSYNLGNTFMMLGEYDKSIEMYERALKIDAKFKEAQDNLVVAKARKILKEPENDGQEGVGALGADKIVFDNTQNKGVDDEQSTKQEASEGNPSWLDRLQTSPKDFLKNKFSYQYQMQKKNVQGNKYEN